MLAALLAAGCAGEPWTPSQGSSSYPRVPAPFDVAGPHGETAPPASGPPTDTAARAVAFVKGKLGAPYCWGGVGPSCFDCSGLTHAAWKAAGRSIPRTSEQQRSGLTAVPLGEIRPGDIVWRPGHVGLYVGGGLVVHATKTGDVVRAHPLAGYVKALRP